MEYYMAFIKAQKIIRDDSGRIRQIRRRGGNRIRNAFRHRQLEDIPCQKDKGQQNRYHSSQTVSVRSQGQPLTFPSSSEKASPSGDFAGVSFAYVPIYVYSHYFIINHTICTNTNF